MRIRIESTDAENRIESIVECTDEPRLLMRKRWFYEWVEQILESDGTLTIKKWRE